MFSSISPPHPSLCFIPQTFSFGFNHDTYYHDLLLHHYNNLTTCTTTTTPPLIPPILTNQETHLPNDQYGLNNVPRFKKQITKRKDRHCKIVTAQGLRDRRVRLSTGIAREFFDLQDLLGFDKASKTLDWLLTKSRTAIRELVQMKQRMVEESHVITSFTTAEDSDNNLVYINNNKSTFCTNNKESPRFGGQKSVQVFENSAKELRAKARARARERTLEKYCIRKLSINQDDGVKKQIMPNSKPSSNSQLGSWSTCESELFCFCQLNGKDEITSEDFWKFGCNYKQDIQALNTTTTFLDQLDD